MLWASLLLLGLMGAGPAAAQQVAFYNLTSPFENFSDTCIFNLNSVVACDKRLPDLLTMDNLYYSEATLGAICTTGCATALNNWVRRVAGSCNGGKYTVGPATYVAAYMAQAILEKHSTKCLKNTEGKYCNALLSSAFNAVGTQTAVPSSVQCHTCIASVLSTEAQMPIGNARTELRDAYSTHTSNCKVAGKALTTIATTTKWIEVAATSTPKCDGKTYTLKQDESCRSVALSAGISTTNLLYANNLNAFCGNFPTAAGTQLCIPSEFTCKPYQLKLGSKEDCSALAKTAGAHWAQIVSWNPEVGEYCENIDYLTTGGSVLCVSTPGGDWVNPEPEETPAETSTTETWFTLPPTPFASVAAPQYTPNFPNIDYMDVIANETRRSCLQYRSPPVNIGYEASYRCSDYANFYGISMTSLVEWNPSLEARLGTDGDCYLRAGELYCSQVESDNSNKMSKYCSSTAVAEAGERSTCDGFLHWYGLKVERFAEWNSNVGSDCKSFKTGREYCVAVSGFRPSNTIASCTNWHLATAADVSASDPCAKIATKYGHQTARFQAWNPSLGSSCAGLQAGYEYCIGIPGYPPKQ
jgi:hypothetical protein